MLILFLFYHNKFENDKRSYTTTVDENFTSKDNLSFAIIQSRSRPGPTMWAKFPKNKLVRAVSELK